MLTADRVNSSRNFALHEIASYLLASIISHEYFDPFCNVKCKFLTKLLFEGTSYVYKDLVVASCGHTLVRAGELSSLAARETNQEAATGETFLCSLAR